MALCSGIDGQVCNHAVLVDGMICVRCDERRAASRACVCAGPFSNVTVDGNAGHSPGCPANPLASAPVVSGEET